MVSILLGTGDKLHSHPLHKKKRCHPLTICHKGLNVSALRFPITIAIFREKRQPFQSLDTIPIQPGIRLFYQKNIFTQKQGFARFNLAAYWKRKYRGKQEDEPWYLLTNLPSLKSALGAYRQRYGIEPMFKDCKTGGYNLEGCQASPDKLISLMILIALPMTSAWLR